MLKLALSGVVAASADYRLKGAEGVAAPSPLPIPAGKPIVIRSVDLVAYERPECGWNGVPRNNGEKQPQVACRIVSENGSFGLSDRPLKRMPEDWQPWKKSIEAFLIGKDARSVELLHDTMRASDQGRKLVDRALWDLIARDAGKPLHCALGDKAQGNSILLFQRRDQSHSQYQCP